MIRYTNMSSRLTLYWQDAIELPWRKLAQDIWVSNYKPYQVKEVLGHVPEHAGVGGSQYILGLVGPALVPRVCLQVIDVLKHTCWTNVQVLKFVGN